jgi:site-specific recombinase XerD
MIESLFAFASSRLRYQNAPLLQEREEYLLHLLNQGRSHKQVMLAASMLLNSLRMLNLADARSVDRLEIASASARWLLDEESHKRRKAGVYSAYNFSRITTHWLRFHGLLVESQKPELPFDKLVNSHLENIQFTNGLASTTISTRRHQISLFQKWIVGRKNCLKDITLNDLDAFLDYLHTQGFLARSVASTSQALRGFFRYCETQSMCAQGIARGILSPRFSKRQTGPKGPAWRNVLQLLRIPTGASPVEIRAKAIIALCSIYGLRRGEVVRLRLKDFDWINETLTIQRSKRGRVQQFPIQYEVGEAILKYLKMGRPRCNCPFVFTTFVTPYRPLQPASVWTIVAERMARLGIQSENRGPHSLRHACATRLLRAGSSLRDIADFLGHRGLSSVSIYAKYDPRLLRRVSNFSLASMQ